MRVRESVVVAVDAAVDKEAAVVGQIVKEQTQARRKITRMDLRVRAMLMEANTKRVDAVEAEETDAAATREVAVANIDTTLWTVKPWVKPDRTEVVVRIA